ncbi:MAG: DUF4167 domain-containing protein [Alphaproteobacteria bacterium]|nr:DUF4167 domain-containing protein [Alphaproteobacteria bacterium]
MTRDNNNNMRRRPNNGGRSNNNNGGRSGGGGGMNRRPRHGGGGHYRSGGGEVNVKQLTQAREKYVTLAREALSANEKIDAEYYYQHVEHYSRMLKELGEQVGEQRQEQRSDAPVDDGQGNRASGAENPAPEQSQQPYRRHAPQRTQEAAEESVPAPVAAAENTEDTASVIS